MAQPPTLRPYQGQLINQLYDKINQGYRRIAIVAGTGAGKTVISGQICAQAVAHGCRLLFLVHLDVLVEQTFNKMEAFGLDCGFIKAGWPENPEAPIQIASVQTMAKRSWWQNWSANLVFFDEGHTTVFSQIGQQVLHETHTQAIHLALTATPYRLGQEQLGDYFETLVASPVPSELQRMGFLAPMRYYSMPAEGQVDLGGIRTVAGDYDGQDLKNACDRPELVERIVAEWHRLCPGKRTIAFCVDIDHARHVAAAFQAVGVPADVVEGGTPVKQRRQLYQALRDGTLLVLTSCNVISIGFDEPSVEVGLLLRPTQSLALHHQQIGRVMRISPQSGKAYGLILDQAGNVQRLGFPEDIQDYCLPTQKEPTPGQPAPTKPCPSCGYVVYAFVTDCPSCGHQWIREKILQTDDLVEVINDLSREQLHQLDDEAALIKLFQLQRRRTFQQGQGPNWAKRAFFDLTGRWPQEAWCRGSIFGTQPNPQDQSAYQQYLSRLAQKHGRPVSWVVHELQQEFGDQVMTSA
jgi:superfamily II DNA or RNA helicase